MPTKKPMMDIIIRGSELRLWRFVEESKIAVLILTLRF